MNELVRHGIPAVFFGLAVWALAPVQEILRSGAYEWTIKWIGISHVATVIAVYVGRSRGWVRVVYPAAAILLTGAAFFFTYMAGWNDLDDSGTGMIVLGLGWPVGLWALGTGDLDSQHAEMVRDAVGERSTVGRIMAAVALLAGLFAWIAADLKFVAAIGGSVSLALAATSLWLAATLWSARGELL